VTAAKPISIQGKHQELEAFVAPPAGGSGHGPAVIVIHEIFGPDLHIQGVAQRFAAEGYFAVAPNLFTGEIQRLLTPAAVAASMGFFRGLSPEVLRDPERIRAAIEVRPPEERGPLEAIFRIQDPLQQRRFADDLVEVARSLRGRPEVDPQHVGSVGFCFGGAMSGLLACRDRDLAAAVIFYGNNPPADLIPNIRCPVLGHYGGEDHRITDTVPALVEAMAAAKVRYTPYTYAGAQHAFFNDSRPQLYQAEAAKLAWARTLAFCRENLGAPSSPAPEARADPPRPRRS
jgi:carboxymethylenebutenolidase